MLCGLLVSLAVAASGLQGNPTPGYIKGKKLASFSLNADGKVATTGLIGNGGTFYILSFSGTLTTPGGRAADAMYLYQNPWQHESRPLPSFQPYVMYMPKGVFNYRPLPFFEESSRKPAYNSSHTYDVLILPAEDKDMGFAVPPTYWDYPADKPKDNLAGTIQVEIFQAIPHSGPLPPKLEAIDGHSLFISEFGDPKRLPFPNSELSKAAPAAMEFLATKKPAVELKGVAADGVSVVFLRAPATETGSAIFTLKGEGGLYPLGGDIFGGPGKKSLTVTTQVRTANGKPEPWLFAIYRPPTFFGRTGPSRPISITFEQALKGKAEKVRAEAAFSLVRPPIVLVHGTYDNPKSCWVSNTERIGSREVFWPKSMTMRLKDEGFSNVFLVDWEATNGSKDPSDFKTNQKAVLENKDGIRAAVNSMRGQGIAVTQADLICHSQGGVISRVFAKGEDIDKKPNPSDPHYTNPENCRACWYHSGETFHMGYIHSLITISSTHRGSDVCRLLEAYKKYKGGGYNLDRWWMGLFVWYVDNFESGITTGGFHDQTPGTPRLMTVGPTGVPSHAIAASAANEDMHEYGGLYIGRLKKLWGKTPMDAIVFAMNEMGQPEDASRLQKLQQEYEQATSESEKNQAYNRCLYALREAVFDHDENDCTVAVKSSLGGLMGPFATLCPRMLHGYAPRHDTVQDAVVKVLNGGPDFLSPTGFPDAYTHQVATWRMPDADPNAPKAKPPVFGPEYQPPLKPKPRDPDIPAPNLNSVGATPPTGAGPPLGAAVGGGGALPSPNRQPNAPAPKAANPLSLGGRLEEARAAAEADPNNAIAQTAYAAALIRAGQFAEAEQAAKVAVKLDRADAAPRLILAISFVKQGQFAKAEAHFRESLVIEYGNPWAHAGLGECLSAQKKWAPAERSYREAIKLAPKEGAWHAELALALYRLNRVPEAKKEAMAARSLGIKNHKVFAPLGIR